MTLRDVTIPNRIWLAPMCQYSCLERDGMPGDWHLVHLGARATGGFGLVLTEAAAVSPEGRISVHDAGIWNDDQAAAWARIAAFISAQGAVPGIQLAHAGRKASTFSFRQHGHGTVPLAEGGWRTVAPSALPFDSYATPSALDQAGIDQVVADFSAAAARADRAGFAVAELHAAHGYLLHEFLSPLSNRRTDSYGGSLANRARLLIDVVRAVRETWPATKPLFVRFSGTDWTEDGWTVDDTAEVAGWLADEGVDLVDISSGGNVASAPIPVGPGYQVPLAQQVRTISGLPTAAVGLITEPGQAADIVASGQADAVLLARAALREPAWPQRAAAELGLPTTESPYPAQYVRGAWPEQTVRPSYLDLGRSA
ncbi:2,4-dienoyl-CoA reductase-like NADH-dependent reductase (Old Yellow Enzyme family) [Microlunatus panaciterrae]|uniref:2,4-dienoyl-CoA reductase-like NADH-dependent reductase (Old Yellow Enzyme family) n=2 Tax=Microlunatus panaciterrae TaxID=400768 RepID=A0ABS2RKP5_9ACTN|nr:2,4-dienoyl-CoA reductase-like NADH-dependent reductase (Old Yellow Enzyme family) [Microlunatus panaciterrae]